MRKMFFVVTAVMISSRLLSQDSTSRTLDEVILTANKFEQKQSTTGKVVTVIGKEQLSRSAGKTLAEVLTEQAGVFISGAHNAQGSVQTVFMRGASSGRMLILVDGIPVNDPSMINNEFDLNLLLLQDVERIEISKGAQSTLYGSDAIAGVINIITVNSEALKKFQLKGMLGLGNRFTTKDGIKVYGRIKNFGYAAGISQAHTAGFSSAYDSMRTGQYDKDGFDGSVLNAAIDYRIVPALSVKSFVRYSKYRADVDAAAFTDDKDYTINNNDLSAGGGLAFKKGITDIHANYQYAKIKRRYLNDSLDAPGFAKFESNRYGGVTQFAELFASVRPGSWISLLAGADYRKGSMNQQYFSVSGFGPYESEFENKSLHQVSAYASVFLDFLNERLNLEAGGRYNDHSRYGSNSTYTFHSSYRVAEHWRVFAGIASGYKAPSIFQVYDAYSGNQELKPETSVNYEAGVQQQQTKVNNRLVFFHREIKNGIDYDYINFSYFNFVKQTVNGIEWELEAKPTDKFDIRTNYTFISGEEQTQSRENFNDTTYNYLLRRPRHQFNLNLGYRFYPEFYASITARTVSKRYDVGGFMAKDIPVKGYFLLGAYAEYRANERIKLFIDLKNITDTKFFDIRGYNTTPVTLIGGISFGL
jgi:vitamin B12 transporter